MKAKTQHLWDQQNRHPGDRERLFRALGKAVRANAVLYPGSYVDIAPSFAFPDVTYADTDKRAAAFFEDTQGVTKIIQANNPVVTTPSFRFIHGDFTALDLPLKSFDLLISPYAGFVSEACGKFLAPRGHLLVNSSHGDAALASIDPRFQLVGVVHSAKGTYRIDAKNLDHYMIPKKPTEVTRELVHSTRRGIAYTRSPFAYLFRRII